MFQPSDEFLHSKYVNINGLTYNFTDIINILDDPKLFSIAIHYRINGNDDDNTHVDDVYNDNDHDDDK